MLPGLRPFRGRGPLAQKLRFVGHKWLAQELQSHPVPVRENQSAFKGWRVVAAQGDDG